MKKRRKKKNGAHNHLITPKKLRHQNIHVMLSYAKISQRNLQTQANHRYWVTHTDKMQVNVSNDKDFWMKRRKKRSTQSSHHTTRNLDTKIFTSCCFMPLQSILSITPTKCSCLLTAANDLVKGDYWRTIFKRDKKKRSTQSSLTSSETQSIKIFTSCCLMQI